MAGARVSSVRSNPMNEHSAADADYIAFFGAVGQSMASGKDVSANSLLS